MNKTKSFFSFFIVLWFGMVLGVSMFSAPIKFLVPDMSREVQLQLGSLTFKYFNYIEWTILALVLISLIALLLKSELKRPKLIMLLTLILLLVLLADSFYILPVLHNYVAALTSGQASIDTSGNIALYHGLYIYGDLIKLVLQFCIYLNSALAE